MMQLAVLSIHSSPLGRAGGKDTGGMSTYLRGLSLALGQRGHRVDLFTRRVDPGAETVCRLGPNVRLICPDDGLGELDKNLLYPHCPEVAESIVRFSKSDRCQYDYIFSHYWLSGVAGRILKERWHIPHLIMFHTLGRAKNETSPGENESALRLQTEADLARNCDLLVASAGGEKERMVEYFDLRPEKVALIPCGIDRNLFYPYDRQGRLAAKKQTGLLGDGKTILAVGRIEAVKGFYLLLDAAALLPAQDNFAVVIAGGEGRNKALNAALKEKARQPGLDGKVRFAGIIEHERLPLYYNAADAVAITSHYESFGLAALEALACGTPVVASPVGVLPELLGHNSAFGALVEGRDPARWAAAMRRVYRAGKPITGAALEAGLAPYSWPEAAKGLESALQAL